MRDGIPRIRETGKSGIRKIRPISSGPLFILFTAIIVLATYALDVMTPLGMPVWLLYFIPLALSYWSDKDYAIPALCAVILLFLAAGLVFSREGGVHISIAFIIRVAFGIVVIAVSSALQMAQRRRMQEEILHGS